MVSATVLLDQYQPHVDNHIILNDLFSYWCTHWCV